MRILIIRTSALGDIVHCLPVIRALRRGLPDAGLAWVVEAPFAPVLEGHPELDRIIPVRLREWRRRPLDGDTRSELSALRQALRDFAPDVALDLMGNHKAAVLAALSGAPRRLGAQRRDRREPSSAVWLNEAVAVEGAHAVDRALSLAARLGASTGEVDFGGSSILPGGIAPPDGEYALIHPGAGWENKRYPAELWGDVAHGLREHLGLSTIVSPGPGEEPLAAAVAAQSRGAARPVEPAGLTDLAALLRGARIVLGGDTGPLHLAHALGAAVLCLMGPTDPARNGPYDAPDRALWTRLPCSFCYQRLESPKACLELLAPATVIARVEAILGVTAVL